MVLGVWRRPSPGSTVGKHHSRASVNRKRDEPQSSLTLRVGVVTRTAARMNQAKSCRRSRRGCAITFYLPLIRSPRFDVRTEALIAGSRCDSLSLAVNQPRSVTLKRSVPGLLDQIISGRRAGPVTSQTRHMGPTAPRPGMAVPARSDRPMRSRRGFAFSRVR